MSDRTSINVKAATNEALSVVATQLDVSKAQLVGDLSETLLLERNALSVISTHLGKVNVSSILSLGIEALLEQAEIKRLQRRVQQDSLINQPTPINLYTAIRELATAGLTVDELAALVGDRYPELAQEALDFSAKRSDIINQRFSSQSLLIARATQSELYVDSNGYLMAC